MISLLQTSLLYGLVAQVVEQETENLRVGGASPSQATINTNLFREGALYAVR